VLVLVTVVSIVFLIDINKSINTILTSEIKLIKSRKPISYIMNGDIDLTLTRYVSITYAAIS
jgi:hypothetical protein